MLADAGHDVDADRAQPNCGWFLVRRWCEKSKQYIPMQVALTLCHVRRLCITTRSATGLGRG